MKAVLVTPPTPGARIGEAPVPTRPAGSVRVRVVEVGVCGTDRDIASGQYGRAPDGRADLILGHENLGRVVEAAEGVPGPSVGDWVVATVRRGCGRCACCAANRSDSCESGGFRERGIGGLDGYWAEQYVEDPANIVRVPPELHGVAVLLEPLSVVEKAIRVGAADRSARRPNVPSPGPLRTLVAGSGAVGTLAALALRAREAEVTVVDRHPGDTPAGRLLERCGAVHRGIDEVAGSGAEFDLVVEATGSPQVAFDMADRLAPNGCLVLTGIPDAGTGPAPEAVGRWARELVLGNRGVVGSVNAARLDFEAGLADLAVFERRWPGVAWALRTSTRPLDDAPAVLAQRLPGEVKTVLTVSEAGAPGARANPK